MHSHAQHFLDRLTLGYGWGGDWQKPRVDVASVFIDQFPEGDLARDRVKRHNLKLYPTIAEALTLGGEKLAVDGVVIIGEHGDYPENEKGQRLYPRYEWFKEVVKVFEASGRAVPVFNDKHLSTTWARCKEMVDDAKRLGFPFLAGSSLPVTWRLPSIDVPHGAPLVESVCVGYGGVDSYDFHGLETAQCMSERRKGGEVGIKSVHALRGETMWEHLATEDRKNTSRLLAAALRRSHTLPVKEGYVDGSDQRRLGAARVAGDARLLHRASRRLSHDAVSDATSRTSTTPDCEATPTRSSPARCICRCRCTAPRRPTSSIRSCGTSKRWCSRTARPIPSSGRC